MAKDLQRRAREIFLELSTIVDPDVSRYIDELVGDDTLLREAVVSLLDARQAADEAGLMTSKASASGSAPITESAGSVIGPYKILQRIGEGGFGSVFLAQQASPVRRRVALKIIKLGMDTKQVIARFEAERQALALMDHPHIARVFDAGATESGRPFFAMEYVVGDAITTFADAYKLDIPARLELLSQVCSAVQHAHTKGVIHRDLKPANVLVSMVDGKPFAKVIDFGIAKATASPLTDKTLFTEHRQLIGTPEYMSPEQADGSPDIDTRTDVYALGVLLYELLTGATPFDAARLRSAAWVEMQRIIREEEPPIPSMRLTRDVNTLAKTAAARSIEPPKLSTSIRGELDWIAMKALDKDRGRRYATPADLAEDIGNHIAGEAVEAAPPS
ncbi:MAG: serine/threonine-protein kinase, partial [Planctomycetota bacterium]